MSRSSSKLVGSQSFSVVLRPLQTRTVKSPTERFSCATGSRQSSSDYMGFAFLSDLLGHYGASSRHSVRALMLDNSNQGSSTFHKCQVLVRLIAVRRLSGECDVDPYGLRRLSESDQDRQSFGRQAHQ